MNIKKSIEWLKLKRKCDDRIFQDSIIERHQKIDEIIEILENAEEGEKYKKIVQELEDEAKARKTFVVPEEYLAKQGGVMEYLIKELKEKYFPLVKKYITIEVESEKESEVDAGMEDIKELVDNMGCPKMKIANLWVEVDKE